MKVVYVGVSEAEQAKMVEAQAATFKFPWQQTQDEDLYVIDVMDGEAERAQKMKNREKFFAGLRASLAASVKHDAEVVFLKRAGAIEKVYELRAGMPVEIEPADPGDKLGVEFLAKVDTLVKVGRLKYAAAQPAPADAAEEQMSAATPPPIPQRGGAARGKGAR